MSRPSVSSRERTSACSRARASGGRPSIPARSTRSSTFEATLLTFWPPGPDERLARKESAAAGTVTPSPTTIGSATATSSFDSR